MLTPCASSTLRRFWRFSTPRRKSTPACHRSAVPRCDCSTACRSQCTPVTAWSCDTTTQGGHICSSPPSPATRYACRAVPCSPDAWWPRGSASDVRRSASRPSPPFWRAGTRRCPIGHADCAYRRRRWCTCCGPRARGRRAVPSARSGSAGVAPNARWAARSSSSRDHRRHRAQSPLRAGTWSPNRHRRYLPQPPRPLPRCASCCCDTAGWSPHRPGSEHRAGRGVVPRPDTRVQIDDVPRPAVRPGLQGAEVVPR